MPGNTSAPRHSGVIRVTHWIVTLCFFALLLTGGLIVISHPRFYWGEEGSVLMPALFSLPIPASRGSVSTGYSFVLKDQNGWSRYLHFQAGWIVVFTALVYAIHGLWTRHFRDNLMPSVAELTGRALFGVIRKHLRFQPPDEAEARSYNVLQRVTYLTVIFVLFPAMIWTGLAMSPAFTAACPFVADILGGFQSARTIHFLVTVALALFVAVHVAMIWLAGFGSRMKAMTTGTPKERA